MTETDYYKLIKQTLLKQKLKTDKLIKIYPEFYQDIIKYKNQQDRYIQEQIKEMIITLYRKRNTLIIQYAVSSNGDYSGYLSIEEYSFFKEIQHANKKLKAELRI